MSERFKAGWYFVGGKTHQHWIGNNNMRRMTHCGIAAHPNRIYSGYGTQQCKECLKRLQENGRVKR